MLQHCKYSDMSMCYINTQQEFVVEICSKISGVKVAWLILFALPLCDLTKPSVSR